MKNQYDIENNIAQVLNLIGDRWSLLILFEIYKGNNTYNSIQKSLGKIPTNLLAERLKSLEVDDLIKAEKYEDHPPRYRYSLTESGSDLKDVFRSLSIWGQNTYMNPIPTTFILIVDMKLKFVIIARNVTK